jgi:hypothetical protein
MVGFLLVVIRHWDKLTDMYGTPILRVVAAPLLMTCETLSFSHNTTGGVDGAILAEDIWSTPPAFLVPTDHMSLMVAAGGGRIREKTTSTTLPGIILSTDTLVFLSAFDLAGSIDIAGVTVWKSWLLPLGCNAPIGLTCGKWKVSRLMRSLHP